MAIFVPYKVFTYGTDVLKQIADILSMYMGDILVNE